MEILPIGTVTLFTNVDRHDSTLLNDETTDLISKTLVTVLTDKIKASFEEDTIIVVGYKTQIGCVITTITLGLILKSLGGVGAVAGAYKFIKDYDKIRNNLKLIFQDLKYGYLKIKNRHASSDKLPAVSAEDIEYYESIPDDLKKYAGGEVVFISEKEIITHKVAILREDLVDHIEITKIQKQVINIDVKKLPVRQD